MDLQTLQTIYYTMSIVFMTLALIAIIALIVLGIHILIKINKIHNQFQAILTEFQENPGGKATEILMGLGSGIASAGVKRMREIIDNKRR